MLGSDIVEDKCRQCGGDGSSCNTVYGTLDTQDLQEGKVSNKNFSYYRKRFYYLKITKNSLKH